MKANPPRCDWRSPNRRLLVAVVGILLFVQANAEQPIGGAADAVGIDAPLAQGSAQKVEPPSDDQLLVQPESGTIPLEGQEAESTAGSESAPLEDAPALVGPLGAGQGQLQVAECSCDDACLARCAHQTVSPSKNSGQFRILAGILRFFSTDKHAFWKSLNLGKLDSEEISFLEKAALFTMLSILSAALVKQANRGLREARSFVGWTSLAAILLTALVLVREQHVKPVDLFAVPSLVLLSGAGLLAALATSVAVHWWKTLTRQLAIGLTAAVPCVILVGFMQHQPIEVLVAASVAVGVCGGFWLIRQNRKAQSVADSDVPGK